jgi:hypothetical protein
VLFKSAAKWIRLSTISMKSLITSGTEIILPFVPDHSKLIRQLYLTVICLLFMSCDLCDAFYLSLSIGNVS